MCLTVLARSVFVGSKRAKPLIMFGVDSLSTQSRIRYRSRVRQRGVMYSSRLRQTTKTVDGEASVRIEINSNMKRPRSG